MSVPMKKKKCRNSNRSAGRRVYHKSLVNVYGESDLDKLLDFSCGVLLKEKFETRSVFYED